jgi:hypothetical protein
MFGLILRQINIFQSHYNQHQFHHIFASEQITVLHKISNQAIMLCPIVEGKRLANPVNLPVVSVPKRCVRRLCRSAS